LFAVPMLPSTTVREVKVIDDVTEPKK
jgi:hypothetical protein